MKQNRDEIIENLQRSIIILKKENALLMKENQLVMKQNEFYFQRNKIQLARIAGMMTLIELSDHKIEKNTIVNEISINQNDTTKDRDDTIDESDQNFMHEIDILTNKQVTGSSSDDISKSGNEPLINNKADSMQDNEILIKKNESVIENNETLIDEEGVSNPLNKLTVSPGDTILGIQSNKDDDNELIKDNRESISSNSETVNINRNAEHDSRRKLSQPPGGIDVQTDTIGIAQDTVKLNYETVTDKIDSIKTFRDTVSNSEDTIKELMEKLKATLRSKYAKSMIRRWSHELIFFAQNRKASTELIMSNLQISRATLMRDLSLFKNKKWIKYTGTKKNGYYVMTEEGLEFMMRRGE